MLHLRSTLLLNHVAAIHLREVVGVDSVRPEHECLLALLIEGQELDAIVLWHDVPLHKLEFRVAVQCFKAELKVDVALNAIN